jgi:hypothetical protein
MVSFAPQHKSEQRSRSESGSCEWKLIEVLCACGSSCLTRGDFKEANADEEVHDEKWAKEKVRQLNCSRTSEAANQCSLTLKRFC